MKKVKKWIVRKLGGMFYEDLPIKIQQELLNEWANRSMDFYSKSLLDNGFKGPTL